MNPLLADEGLPRFDQIAPEHIVPAVKQVLTEAEALVASLELHVQPTWAALLEPLDEIGRRFEYAWGPVGHLFGVKNSDELRTAYEAALPEVVDFSLRVKQSQPIYKALKAIRDGQEWSRLDAAQRRIIEKKILETDLSGISLEGEKRDRFNEIARDLSQLSTEFSNHVLDATKAFSLIITDPADAEGFPQSLRSLTAQSYNKSQKSTDGAPVTTATPEAGPWRITLENAIFGPFMQHSRNRAMREQVYRAFVTRAAAAPFDNTPLCAKILELRQEQAALLGYKTFAEMSLVEKMAGSVAAVEELLEQLRTASWDSAQEEMVELHQLALASGFQGELTHWDVPFWTERLRERKFDFTDEQLRVYFPHDRVLTGLFELIQRLFGVTIQAADGQAPVWNSDVRFFHVMDESHTPIAAFYYDPYSRPENKRPGAWMDNCLTRRWRHISGEFPSDHGTTKVAQGKTLRIPVAHLVCNATPPVGDTPALMTFREVETLFHEFGHGLQHLLTTVDYPDAAGINGVEWDAVELPSQFMENWCYHRPTLMGMTAHYQTGEPLPEELFQKVCQARTFQAGTLMMRQLTFGLTDMELHHRFNPQGTETVFDVQKRIMERTSVLPMLPENRSLCSFSHIFAGGYAAGYYSYKWAEVLSADAFGAFEDAGLDDPKLVAQTGRRFRNTVLAQGGSRHPLEIFRDFRGRGPSPQALLKQNGLSEGSIVKL